MGTVGSQILVDFHGDTVTVVKVADDLTARAEWLPAGSRVLEMTFAEEFATKLTSVNCCCILAAVISGPYGLRRNVFRGGHMREELVEILAAVQEHRVGIEDLELWVVAHLQQDVDEELRAHTDGLDALLIQYGESVLSKAELGESSGGNTSQPDNNRVGSRSVEPWPHCIPQMRPPSVRALR